MSIYRNLEGDQVRMLKIIDPPDSAKSHLVHCVLEHVSLDDFTPDFERFLWERGESCSPQILSNWVELSSAENVISDPPSTSDLSLPLWRLYMHYNGLDNTCFGWEDMMEAIGVDPAQYAMPISHTYDHSKDDLSPTVEFSTKQDCFSFMPRFRWGDFEAVSYCWESETRNKHIVLNETLFAVPKNLEALLQRLRRLRKARSGMKFWIDALCL